MNPFDLFIRELRIRPEADAGAAHNYAFSLPVIRALILQGGLKLRQPVTFLMGENGSGKSTLLEAIAVACGFNAEGGSRNFNFSTQDTHAPLYRHITLIKGTRRPRDGFFLRAESFYNVATEVDHLQDEGSPTLYQSYGGKSLHRQSHGESFLSLVLNRFSGNGLYLLDEPEAALSPTGQFALISALHKLVQSGSQLIIATHSPILSAYPDAEILSLTAEGIAVTPYLQTDHYILARNFLVNPEKILALLLDEDP